MEKAMYLSKVIRITQKDHEGTHAGCWAVDEAGIDSGIGNLYAPFTGKIVKIYPNGANEIWFESLEPVEYPDGTIDYMNILICHDDDISDLWEGKNIKQGAIFYQEGRKGKTTGNHNHIECGKGKFSGTGWHNDSAGYWSINNGKKIDECLWIDDSYTIINSAGYNFKNVVSHFGMPVTRNEKINQIKINNDATIVRARKSPNGEILGYMNPGIYNSLEVKNKDGYDWHKVENELWFAYSTDWAEFFPKKEEMKIEDIQHELDIAKKQVNELTKELNELKERQPKFIFESPKHDYYVIKLNEKEKLYITTNR